MSKTYYPLEYFFNTSGRKQVDDALFLSDHTSYVKNTHFFTIYIGANSVIHASQAGINVGGANVPVNLPDLEGTGSYLGVTGGSNKIVKVEGDTGIDPYAAFTSNADAAWDCEDGLNKTWIINDSKTLTFSKYANGMKGDCRIEITVGGKTITLAGFTGLTNFTERGAGRLDNLDAGEYHFCWTYSEFVDGATTYKYFDWNIRRYFSKS